MGVLNALLSCIVASNFRLSEFDSLLVERKFPVRAATGIPSQRADLACCFGRQRAVLWRTSAKFPVRREKPGILSRLGYFLRGRER